MALGDEASPGEVDGIQAGFGQEGNYIVPVVQLQAVPQDAGEFATGTGPQYIAGWAELVGAEVASVETTVLLSEYDF